jgi:hypothetical protein
MGNMALYSFSVIFLLSVFVRNIRKKVWEIQRSFFRDPLTAGIFLASLVMLFVSMGEKYYPSYPKDEVLIYNILNPFLYLHFFTDMVEQFRCIGRFIWPFYFGFSFWVLYTVVKLIAQYPPRVRAVSLVLISLLGFYEVIDFCRELNKANQRENLFTAASRKEFTSLHIDYTKYQAILPVPYFMVGSEDYDRTIDDKDEWSNYCFRLNMHSNLPLMSCKLSRTPPAFAGALLALVAKDSMTASLSGMFNDKKVLVAVNKKYLSDPGMDMSANEASRAYYFAANEFAKRNGLVAVDSLGDVVYYDWEPNKMKIVGK